MSKIITSNKQKQLADNLSKCLGVECIEADIRRFADDELRVQISTNMRDEDIIIVQSTAKPANDRLMELLLMVDAAKRAGAKKIIAVVPYLGYGRQDRPTYNYGPISARLVASLIEVAGVDHLITLDLHSPQVEGFFRIDVQNLNSAPIFAELFRDRKDFVVVSPDTGGLQRTQKFGIMVGAKFAIVDKSREKFNTCSMNEVIGNVSNKSCVIFDDIVDTGNTLCMAAELLLDCGALSVEACITHAVLSRDALLKLEESKISKIFVTNSIQHNALSSKFFINDITQLFANEIKRIINK
ncbi:MAG: Ribose-phosphate pyrophosphokinase [candidate division TM6 bacterium GW2011_GWF2_37_49]|nr:MAG: Ribose-phosphate pyrophosphokinase [candidate division TM6 bacterium GW2011_GWF2_37_49]